MKIWMYFFNHLVQIFQIQKVRGFKPFNFWDFLLIFLVVISSRSLAFVAYLIGARLTENMEFSELSLLSLENLNFIINSATFYGDFSWYLSTAEEGYTVREFNPTVQTNWAYFPLQGWLSLLINSPNSRFIAGIFFFAVGLIFFHRLASHFLDGSSVMFAVLLVAFWPGSYVLSQFRPEALFFSFGAMAIYFSVRQMFIPTLLALLVVSLSKPNGFLLLLVILPVIIDIHKQSNTSPIKWLKAGALGLTGFVGPLYMTAVSYSVSGNALAWTSIQAAWGASLSRPWLQIKQLLTDPLIIGRWGWDFELFNWIVVALCIVALQHLVKKKHYIFAVYVGAYALMTFMNFGNWVFIRHTATCIPLFIGLALITNENLRQALIAISAIMLGVLMVVAGSGYIPGLF